MIVLTYVKKDTSRIVQPGDEFHLTISDAFNTEVVIREQITKHKVIDFIATYCFTLEDGTVPGFHLAGIFGNQGELPEEIKNAIPVYDLPEEKLKNFITTCGKRLINNSGHTIEYDDMFTEKPCHICGEPINKMKNYTFDIDGNYAHKDCYDNALHCHSCNKPISTLEGYGSLGDKNYHQNCLPMNVDSKSTLWRKMLDRLK